MTPDPETMIAALEGTGDFRVLRRLARRPALDVGNTELRAGLVLDVETTGLDVQRDEIIELCMLPFSFTPDGRVVEIGEPFYGLNQPTRPIPPEITKITGIDDAMVQNHKLDRAEVESFAAPAAVVIAHNAGFDRPITERAFPAFKAKAWACSMSQIDWAAEDFEGTKLGYLAQACGFFYDRHKAAEDCAALLELLARPLPRSGAPALAKLLETARRYDTRIWAIGSPFESKDVLKARGYHWNDGTDGRPKAWWADVPEADAGAEIAFLQKDIYRRRVDLRTERISAFNRFTGVV